MTYARTAINPSGFVIIDPSRYQVPNTTELVNLPEDLSVEELRHYDLFKLVVEGSEKGPLQELKQVRVELDQETRTMTQYVEAVDLPLDAMRKALKGLVDSIRKRAFSEGIIFEGIFCDINGNDIDAKVQLGNDVDRTMDAVYAAILQPEMIMINETTFVKLGTDEDDIRLKSLAYRERLGVWNIRMSRVHIAAHEAIVNTQSSDQLVAAYEEALELAEQFLGD